MLKKLALLSIWLALPLCAQTINPNQVRPATTNGQILTTVTANQPPSWQSPATGVGVAATSPCTVNGGAGPITSGTATIFCPGANLQLGYTQQGSGQYALVFFSACNTTGTTGTAFCSPSSGSMTISGGTEGFINWSVPQLPAGITPSQITAIYPFVFKYVFNDIAGGNPSETDHAGFVGSGGLSGCTPLRSGSTGGISSTPLQYSCQATGTLTSIATLIAGASGTTSPLAGGGTLGYALIGMEIDYTGSPITTPGTINLGPGFNWDQSSDTLSLIPYAIYPLTISALEGTPTQPNGTYNLVLDATSSTGPCSGSGGGTNTIWCVANGAGGFTAVPFGGSSASCGRHKRS